MICVLFYLGETLALTSIYKFFVGLMQRFEVRNANGSPEDLDEDRNPNIFTQPLPYKIILTPR